MIKEIEIDGVKHTAVVLGDSWCVDVNEYKKSLYEILEWAVLDPNASIEGSHLYTYIQLLRAFEDKQEAKKGGKV